MPQSKHSRWLIGVAFTLVAVRGAVAQPKATAVDCSNWTLDGYRLGMQGDELLSVRSVTLHVRGQAQAIEPGKFHGVLVLDPLDRLDKWDAVYDKAEGDELRADIRKRLGSPISDITGTVPGDEPDSVRQRRTIWWGASCDAAIIVYENTTLRGSPGHSVAATLARASMLPAGLPHMTTLFH